MSKNPVYIWNKEKGVEGTVEILWRGFRPVMEESHFNVVVKEMVRIKSSDNTGEEYFNEVDVRYFEELIRDRYIVSHEKGKPVEYMRKHTMI